MRAGRAGLVLLPLLVAQLFVVSTAQRGVAALNEAQEQKEEEEPARTEFVPATCLGADDGTGSAATCTGADDGTGAACAIQAGDQCAVDCTFTAAVATTACALDTDSSACAVAGGVCKFTAATGDPDAGLEGLVLPILVLGAVGGALWFKQKARDTEHEGAEAEHDKNATKCTNPVADMEHDDHSKQRNIQDEDDDI